MPNPVSPVIEQLRAAGCRVSAVIGHDPTTGTWAYAVTPPARLEVIERELHRLTLRNDRVARGNITPDRARVVVYAHAAECAADYLSGIYDALQGTTADGKQAHPDVMRKVDRALDEIRFGDGSRAVDALVDALGAAVRALGLHIPTV